MLLMKIVCGLVGGAGLTFGVICWAISRMECGDEIAGGISDCCFGFAFLGAAAYCFARWGHWLSIAY